LIFNNCGLFVKSIKTSLVFYIFAFCTLQVYAATHENYHHEAPSVFNHNDSIVGALLLVENSEESITYSDPQSGDLVIPGAKENEGKEKQCVTVCDEWGKNCVINPENAEECANHSAKSVSK